MPELPEVETVKNDLRPLLVKRRIVDVKIRLPKIVTLPASRFARLVKGEYIKDVRRRAKILLIDLSSGWTICLHLKMSGQLIFSSQRGVERSGGHHIKGGTISLPNKYSHVIFSLSGSRRLFFNDMRQFGYITIKRTNDLNAFFLTKKLGPEPFSLTFTISYFISCLRDRPRSAIKNALLDQSLVSGLGNIYADEVLFAARVKPIRRVQSLSSVEKQRIHSSIKSVLKTAVKLRGTTFRDFRDGRGQPGGMFQRLMVYGRNGQLCRRCKKGTIRKIRQGSRSSSFCPVCQR